MHQIKNILPILALIVLFACIKPYSPVIEGSEASKLVVSGRITGTEGLQTVTVSTSSPVENANFIPVTGCTVSVLDDRGNIFELEDAGNGSYQAWLAQEYLNEGTAYKVSVRTPDGDLIESAYDTLLTGTGIDSLYYILEDIPTSDPDNNLKVMQFYIDLIANESQSHFYKWEIRETWEFHSPHPLEFYYDGKFHEVIPPDYSRMVCWANIMVKDVFLLSTKNLSQNESLKNPLHFLDGSTSRLSVMYSMLVSQQALTESTFNYFEVVRKNSGGFAGLYEQQPFSIKGNLLNLTHPEKDVLGYFYACSEFSRRYFYHDIEGLDLNFWNGCSESPLPISGWAGFSKAQYPVFYYYNEDQDLRILSDECIDCRVRGGSTIKPDFWPQ